MLDIEAYRAAERLAKANMPSWRIAAAHSLEHFERSGFPVRINSIQELATLLDTMQENRFDAYMNEMGGLTSLEHARITRICASLVEFQLIHFPYRAPILPLSTLMSVSCLYRKLKGVNKLFKSVLEIGPGSGYLSCLLRDNSFIEDYTQIESCESFYLLQNLINNFFFEIDHNEMVFAGNHKGAAYLICAETELSPIIRISNEKKCHHIPWWRLASVGYSGQKFQIVTSNANLLEFSPSALDTYLTLIHDVMEPNGAFLVQCLGCDAYNSYASLPKKLGDKGFVVVASPMLTVTNLLITRSDYPENAKHLVQDVFYSPPEGRNMYTKQDFVAEVEKHFG